MRVLTTRDKIPVTVTESIRYHSQSEACVGGLSLKALTCNEMDTFIISFINIKPF